MTWHEKERASCRKPILDSEVPALEALGRAIEAAREAAGLRRWELAAWAELSEHHLLRLEAGVRRTRASTLVRIAEAIVKGEAETADVPPGRAQALLGRFLAAGAGVVADESPFAERLDRRRARRQRRLQREAEEIERMLAEREERAQRWRETYGH